MSIKIINFLADKSHHVGKSKFSELEAAVMSYHGNCCHYCNASVSLTIDHKIPRAKGGGDDFDNLLPACKTCNSQKRDKSYDDFIEWRNMQVVAFETFGAMADCL